MKKLPIVCLDIETTGLDVLKCEPIELALVELARRDNLYCAGSSFNHVLLAPPLEAWEQGAIDLHKKSGLISASDARSARDEPWTNDDATRVLESYEETETRALAWLNDIFPGTQIIACGNNVGAFDLVILKRRMPELAAKFYYRTLDVSSLRVAMACLQWGSVPKKHRPHRAYSDCLETIRELNCYDAQAAEQLTRNAEAGDHALRLWRQAGIDAEIDVE